jgi:CheY-like chemotaxis protein
VALPLASGAEERRASGPAPRAAPLSILLVEDNEDAGATLAEVLSLAGHRVRVVATGRAGVEAAAASPPDVLLCDLGLPDISGLDVVRAIRAAEPARSTFAIALTGYAQPRDREAALAAGFDAHLAKPIEPSVLRQTLAALVRAARAAARAASTPTAAAAV